MSGLLLLGACSSATSTTTTSSTETPTSAPLEAPPVTPAGPPATSTTTTTEQGPTSQEETPLRTDLLTFANGAFVVDHTGITGQGDARALAIIDGNDETRPLVEGSDPNVTVTVQLPAPTSFDRFAVQGTVEPSSDETLFRTITIEGSADGPEGPWSLLAQTDLHAPLVTAEMVALQVDPVMWIRLTLGGGVEPAEDAYVFTELVGNGTQDPIVFAEPFSGTWEVRRFDSPDTQGRVLSLSQSGSVISGCLGELVVSGTVDGAVARALAADPRAGISRALLFVQGQDGELIVAVTEDDRIEAARGLVSDRGASCDAPPPEPPSCGDTVHILFDVDSAAIRRDSGRVLDDLFLGLDSATASTITIIGHTSTEGEDDYNQDLSERRAAAVVDELIRRGLDAQIIMSEGRGETEPLVTPELDEAGRSLNRRVEVSCTP